MQVFRGGNFYRGQLAHENYPLYSVVIFKYSIHVVIFN